MKMTLTVDEANKHLSNYFTQVLKMAVIVSVDFDPLKNNSQFIDYTNLRNLHNPGNPTYNKIQFIKDLRTAIPGMGLADAKYCVESSLDTIRSVLVKYNTLVNFSVNMNNL